jgi:hypothetical protein
MQVRGNIVFPTLIPTLLVTPITTFNARALSSLITVAGSSLSKRLGSILPTLMRGLTQSDDAVQDIKTTLSVLLAHIHGPEAIHHVMTTLFEVVKDGKEVDKECGFVTLRLFFESCKEDEDVAGYLSDWIVLLMGLMNGREGDVVLKAAWGALDALVKRLKKEEMDKYVSVMYRGLVDAEQYLSSEDTMAGFCLPKVMHYTIIPLSLLTHKT